MNLEAPKSLHYEFPLDGTPNDTAFLQTVLKLLSVC